MRATRFKPKSIDIAIKIYYENSEIGNAEIAELFGKMSSSTAVRLKKDVQKVMADRGVESYRAHTVNTEIAYEVWGLNIADLERRRAKLKKLDINIA